MPALLLLTILPTVAGCDDQRASRSLVGAWTVAADPILAQESVSLRFRKYGSGDLSRTLSFTLEPDGMLRVERGADHHVCCFGGVDWHVVESVQRVRLTLEQAKQVRRMLARLRPERLTSDLPFSLPDGCSFISDGASIASVTFDRGRIGGGFIFQSGCQGPGARQTRSLLRAVLLALPPVDGAKAFLPSPA